MFKEIKLISFINSSFRFMLLNLTDLTLCLFRKIMKPQTDEKRLLLLRLDAIGDYILFRNFIREFANSKKYQNYKITLVIRDDCKEIANMFDDKYITRFIGFNEKKFFYSPIYRFNKLLEITSDLYDIVIQPTLSRYFFKEDSIVKLVSAKQKIGNIGFADNIYPWLKKISDKYYTKLIPANRKIMFEFYRNKEFFEQIIDEKIKVKKPKLCLSSYNCRYKFPFDYVVIFIGASSSYRKWPISKYVEVAQFVEKNYGLKIVLAGGPSDVQDADVFEKMYSPKCYNLVGQTSLIDLIFIISNSSLLVSNETSAPHIAVALEIPVVVIYNGIHFGRFIPYPKELTEQYYPVYHPVIEQNLDAYMISSNTSGLKGDLDINEIDTKMVIVKLEQVLKKIIKK